MNEYENTNRFKNYIFVYVLLDIYKTCLQCCHFMGVGLFTDHSLCWICYVVYRLLVINVWNLDDIDV